MDQAVQKPFVSLMGDANMLLPVSIFKRPLKVDHELASAGVRTVGELLARSLEDIKKILDFEDRIKIDSDLWKHGYRFGEGYKEGIYLASVKNSIDEVRQAYGLSGDVDVPADWQSVDGRDTLKHIPFKKSHVVTGFARVAAVDGVRELPRVSAGKPSLSDGPQLL